MRWLRGAPAVRVVRTYGRDSLLIAVNPILSAIEAAFGLRIGFRSDADIRDGMEKDALAMQAEGYRVVTAEEFAVPAFAATPARANWYRITYQRDDASGADAGDRPH
ncbi:MAG TPA: hypothetical protein VGK63_03185 [Candidatus Limnocylindrales bacterium]